MWSLRPDLIRPSPRRRAFQPPPSVAEERGWPAEGTTLPAATYPGRADSSRAQECNVDPQAGFTPAVPQTSRLPGASQRRRGEGLARGGDHCPRRALSGARRLEPERLAHDSERGGDVGHAVYELDTEHTRVLLIALALDD